MFKPIEEAIQAHLIDCIPGVPVLGTYDVADMTTQSSPRLAMQVIWLGFQPTGQKSKAIRLTHRFAVQVIVDTGRARVTDRAIADAGLKEALSRLLDFEPVRGAKATIEASPAPEFDGRALRLSIFLNLPDMIVPE